MVKTSEKSKEAKGGVVDALFSVGAHFAFVKSRRHPSNKPYILGAKNGIEIFDLTKTSVELEKAKQFIEKKGEEGALILWVGGKSEAREATIKAGRSLNMPYVSGRWIGGTLSNFSEIKKRITKLEELTDQREKGELAKYTKKERLLIDRQIDKLNLYFSGLLAMKTVPKVLVVIDPKKEHIAVKEARTMNIPVVALAGSDTNLYDVDYAIPGNDSSRQSITFIIDQLVESYESGKKTAASKKPE